MNGNGDGLIEINLEKKVKETLEEIVERGWVENRAEEILISTAALLYQFLGRKSDRIDKEIIAKIEEQKKEVGFFFPPIAEAFLNWREEGKEDIPEKIKKLAEEIRNHE